MSNSTYAHRARMMRRVRNICGSVWFVGLVVAAVYTVALGPVAASAASLTSVGWIAVLVADTAFVVGLIASGMAVHFEDKSRRIPVSHFDEW